MTGPDAPQQERVSLFERAADYVSAAMGRPTNIIVWFVLVAGWTAAGPYLAKHPFLPAWSVSTGWNFPLNLVTTVAELFIGFLVAAASNRSERNLDRTLAQMSAMEVRNGELEAEQARMLAQNTEVTKDVHTLTAEVHALVRSMAAAAVAAAPQPAAPEPAVRPVSGGPKKA